MNAEKLTQKSAEAIRLAQTLAQEYGNPQIEQVHLLAALLSDETGLIPQLLTAMGATLPSFAAAVKDRMERQPRVASSAHEPGKIYISGETEKTCRDIGAVASFQEKVRSNEVWQIHQRAYKKYYARVLKKNMTKDDFLLWARDAEKLRDEALKQYEVVDDGQRRWIIHKFTQDLNMK